MKHLIVAVLVLITLSGCNTVRGLFSGGSSEEVAVNPLTGEVLTNKLGFAYKNRTTTSKSAEILKYAAQAVAASSSKQEVARAECGGFTFEQIVQLAPSAQAAITKCLSDAQANRPMEIMGQALANATSRYRSDAHAIFAEATNAVNSVQTAAANKWATAGKFLGLGIVANAVEGAVTAGFKATRDVGIAAAENAGDITVGSVNSGQVATTSSNDGEGGSGGGEGAVGGSGIGGGNIDQSGAQGGTIIIGRGNNNAQAYDDGAAFADVGTAQNLEPSATGAINQDVNIDQQPIIDENNAELSNQPENGSNNDAL